MAKATRITIQLGDGEPVVFENTDESPLLAHDRARDYLRDSAIAYKREWHGELAAAAAEARKAALKRELEMIERGETPPPTQTIRPDTIVGTAGVKARG